MYAISVVFGSASIAFLYSTEENATSTYKKIASVAELKEGSVLIQDDFGQHGAFRADSIHGVVLENYDLSKTARAEHMLHINRSQNLASRIATGDPSLRAMSSPPLMMPMGPNGQFPR